MARQRKKQTAQPAAIPQNKVAEEIQRLIHEVGLNTEHPHVDYRVLAEEVVIYLADILSVVGKCESPIEVSMAMGMIKAQQKVPWVRGLRIMPQKTIVGTTFPNTYRVDFLVKDVDSGMLAVVECDGHDFHEKTKEQAQRDKSRDRRLLCNGIPTFRFTGSEIYENPDACGEDALMSIKNAFISMRKQFAGTKTNYGYTISD